MRRRQGPGLSTRDRGVLDLERRWGGSAATAPTKFDEAHRDLGLSPGGYVLVLQALLDDPAAHAHDPVTVSRLRAARDAGRETFGVPRTW